MLFSLLPAITAPDFWVKGIMYNCSVNFSGVMVCILFITVKIVCRAKGRSKGIEKFAPVLW
jgi:hypothetical protein